MGNTIDQQLQKQLAPAMSSYNYVGFFVTDKSKRILAASHDGLGEQPEYDRFLTRALEGETVVSPPFPSVVRMETASHKERSGQPTMFVCAPVRDESFQVVGTLALRIRPEQEFTRTLQLGRLGESGEAPVSKLYLFGRPEDSAFEQPVGDDPRHRHQVVYNRAMARMGCGPAAPRLVSP